MNTIDKLYRVMEIAKCGISLEINPHLTVYETKEQYLDLTTQDLAEVKEVIVDSDNLIVLHVYPDTPVGSISVVSNSVDSVLDRMLEILESRSE